VQTWEIGRWKRLLFQDHLVERALSNRFLVDFRYFLLSIGSYYCSGRFVLIFGIFFGIVFPTPCFRYVVLSSFDLHSVVGQDQFPQRTVYIYRYSWKDTHWCSSWNLVDIFRRRNENYVVVPFYTVNSRQETHLHLSKRRINLKWLNFFSFCLVLVVWTSVIQF